VLGWLTLLPRSWALVFSGSMLLADVASILPAHPVSLSVKLESLWALVFASALVVVLATVRESEARREFLLLRQAAFAGVPSTEPGSMVDRHLDPETGVANRLAFDMRFRAAWDQAAARRHSVALLFFSIDNFAEQKRDLGFRFSEILQVQVAGLLKDSLRRSDDMVARFDNQHFVVMLPGVGTDGATQIAERLRGCVEQMAIYAGQKRHSATVTVGAASLRAKRGTPREKLVDCAVQALEQARCTGTNLVCVEGRGCIPRMS
jgi:diguanylate cyclase (GGDEF)-like protein